MRYLESSLVISLFIRVYKKIFCYYEHSLLSRFIARLSIFWSEALTGSFFAQLLFGELDEEKSWHHSVIYKAVTFPINLLKKISNRISKPLDSSVGNSVILYTLGDILNNILYIPIRIYGLLIFTYTVTAGALYLLFDKPYTKVEMLLHGVLLIISLVCICINRSPRSLYEGSILLQLFGGFFAPNQEVKRGNTKINDKKFVLLAVFIGIFLGVISYLLPLTIFILVVGGIGAFIGILWKVEIGVFLTVAFIPILPTMMLAGLSLLTSLSMGVKLLVNKEFKLKFRLIDVFVLLFAGILIYGCIISYTAIASTKMAMIYIAFILFYFTFVNTIKTRKQLYALIVLVVFVATFVALLGIYQNYTGIATTESWVDEEMFGEITTRVYSTFDNPNVLGEYLILLIPIALAMFWSAKKWLHRFAYVGITGLLALCLIFTSSRGAWLGVMLALAIFIILRDKRLVGLGVIGVLLLPFITPDSVINRMMSIGQDSSSISRISIWSGSLNIVRDYWLSGIGIGTEAFRVVYPAYTLPGAEYALHAHNLYIQILVETGMVGFIIFGFLLYMFYKTALSSYWRTEDNFIATLLIALPAGMTGYLFQGLVDNIWYNYRMVFMFWVIIAFGVVGMRLKNDKSHSCSQ